MKLTVIIIDHTACFDYSFVRVFVFSLNLINDRSQRLSSEAKLYLSNNFIS